MRAANRLIGRSLLVLLAFLAWVGVTCSAPVFLPPAIVGPAPTSTPARVLGAVEITPTAPAGTVPQVEIWDGMITSETSRQYMVNGSPMNFCKTHWSTSLGIRVDPDGTVTGTGEATLDGASCTPHALSENTSRFILQVAGRRDASAFHLRLPFLSYEPNTSAEFGGFNLLFSTNACSNPAPRQLDIPLTGLHTASADLTFQEQMTGCAGSKDDLQSAQNTLSLRFRFYCQEMPPEQKETALGSLCH